MLRSAYVLWFFFFNDTATTEIYTLSLHDALPISSMYARLDFVATRLEWLGLTHKTSYWQMLHRIAGAATPDEFAALDRKSTRLNSSHGFKSYAVFCL